MAALWRCLGAPTRAPEATPQPILRITNALGYAAHMIVVSGNLSLVGRHEGLAPAVARRAAATGAVVQVVGVVPDGPDGDARLMALVAAGVGHAAVLRTAARPLERADLDLALRYLPEVRVVVAANLDQDLLSVLVEGAGYAGAVLIVIAPTSARTAADVAGLPDSAIVLQAPASDPDGTFAGFVGALAARLDGGEVPEAAWDATVRALAVDAVSPGRVRGAAPTAR